MEFVDTIERLTVYCGERHHVDGKPTYEYIVEEARRRGLAGATVYRGMMGFGGHSLIHTAKVLRLSEDLPITVEIVDEADKIEEFIDFLEGVVHNGAIVCESVRAKIFHPVEK
ncbi:DUF190 domain-containing protein [Desulfovibrio inopinatus]|uniref:DUF190 domain-containing protein n=1 Tax=Desulfovibrio inopinatus TaxID=102109 RepID=UPI0004140AA8|nr:DUF190 domain-containing protein [Desulfovibrio inopinatus]